MVATKEYTILESHRYRISNLEVWDNGIIFIKLDDNQEVNINDAQDTHNFLEERYDGKTKFKVLTEPGRYSSITKEAREFSTMPETNKMTLASAVVVRSLAHRLVINFIISFVRQQNMRMRMFDNKEKAIEWLLSLENK